MTYQWADSCNIIIVLSVRDVQGVRPNRPMVAKPSYGGKPPPVGFANIQVFRGDFPCFSGLIMNKNWIQLNLTKLRLVLVKLTLNYLYEGRKTNFLHWVIKNLPLDPPPRKKLFIMRHNPLTPFHRVGIPCTSMLSIYLPTSFSS